MSARSFERRRRGAEHAAQGEPAAPGERELPGRAERSALLPGRADVHHAWQAAVGVLAVAALAAIVTAIGFGGAARDALDFGFAGLPRTLPEAGAIFLHNVRLMGAIAAAVIVVQSPWLERADEDGLGRGGELLRTVVDVALGVAVAFNAAVIGVAVGAYRGEMVVAMLPHGPLELAAYALALALYLRARPARLALRPTLTLAAWAVGLLALAALVEAFLHL